MRTFSSKITLLLPTVKLSAFTYNESNPFYFILPTSTHPHQIHPAEVNWQDVTDNKRHDHKHDSLLFSHSATPWDQSCLLFFPLTFLSRLASSRGCWTAASNSSRACFWSSPTLSLWQDNRQSPPAEPQCQPE